MNRYLALQQDDKYLLERRKDGFDLSKFTVVGNPTITNDGILSNCSNGNCVNTKFQISKLKGKSWTIRCSMTAGDTTTTFIKLGNSNSGYIAFSSLQWVSATKRVRFCARTGVTGDFSAEGEKITSPNNSFNIGDKIYCTLSFDITTGIYSLYADKVNGSTLIDTWLPTSSNKELSYINTNPNLYIVLGAGSDGVGYLTTGEADLKDFSVEIEGVEVLTGAKEKYYVLRR